MLECFNNGQVRVREVSVLANHCDRDFLRQHFPPIRELGFPLNHIDGAVACEAQAVADGDVRFLVEHHNRHLPDVGDIVHCENAIGGDLAE